jgi:hypothetical protein
MASKDKITPDAPRPADAAGPAAEAKPAPAARAPGRARAARHFDPVRFARRLARLDVVLVVLTLAFAFLMASFPATNSDLFLNLAGGRLLAQGQYTFGQDPFTFTAEGYWANHAWLFGLILYGLYTLPHGGVVLVVFKGLLMTGLAAAMLRVAWRPGQRLWVPAACCLLALLAVSQRVFLQPVVVSYLLLAVTLALLTGFVRSGGASRGVWLLPVVCALWVNLDAWFFLGPLAIALFTAGTLLQKPPAHGGPSDALPPAGRRTLLLALLASVAACLVGPHHYHALTLPPMLGLFCPAAEVLSGDPQFLAAFTSPFEGVYYQHNFGLSAAGTAFLPLLLLGALSFIPAAPNFGTRLVWWRLFLFVAFALLAAVRVRLMPFFAVVAGPVAALNFLDAAARRPAAVPTVNQRTWAVLGRVLTVLAAVGLLAATWAGWTQMGWAPGTPQRPRPVGWGVVTDPSLQGAVERVQRWHEEGRVGDRYFNTSPDVVNYAAWFAPKLRGFIDQRLELFAGAAGDFVTVRQQLAAAPFDDKAAARAAWREPLAERGVQVVVFHEQPPFRIGGLLRQLLTSDEWAPLYLAGRTSVYGWRGDPRGPRRSFAGLEIDLDRAAFGPDARPAPSERPAREPEPRAWYHGLWRPERGPSPATEEAQMWMVQFAVLGDRYQTPAWRTYWMGRAAEASARGAPSAAAAALHLALLPLPLRPRYLDLLGRAARQELLAYEAYSTGTDNGPPASLYLALRAARRAVAVNPDDAQAWLLLGQAYHYLTWYTTERARGAGLTTLRVIRQAQTAYALNNALALDPDLEHAHDLFAQFYGPEGLNYFDLFVKHTKEAARVRRERGPLPGEKGEDTARRFAADDKEVERLERELKRRQDQFLLAAANRPPLDRAKVALGIGQPPNRRLGLAEKAQEALDEIGPNSEAKAIYEGVPLLIDLLLQLGQVKKVRDDLTPDLGKRIGFHAAARLPSYQWYRTILGAASGDYAAADEALEEAARIAQTVGGRLKGVEAGASFGLGLLLGLRYAGLAAPSPWEVAYMAGQPIPGLNLIDAVGGAAEADAAVWSQQADLLTLRGWLALEAGDIARAHDLLRRAMALSWPPAGALPPLLTLGAGPLEAAVGVRGTLSAVRGPRFNFTARPLAFMGLRWLDANE